MPYVRFQNRRWPAKLALATLFVPALLAAPVLAAPVLAASAQAGDAVAGQAVFRTQCAVCHSTTEGKNAVGPSLFGLVGRKTGSVPGFVYSVANETANLVWNEATLDKYLTAPKATVPGTTMTYAGLKDTTKRADLIAYLATLK